MATTSSPARAQTKTNDPSRKQRNPVASVAVASFVAYWLSRVRVDRQFERRPGSIQLAIGPWIVCVPLIPPLPFCGTPGNLFSFLPWCRSRPEADETAPDDEASKQDGTTRKRRGVTFAAQPTIAPGATTPISRDLASPGAAKRQGAPPRRPQTSHISPQPRPPCLCSTSFGAATPPTLA